MQEDHKADDAHDRTRSHRRCCRRATKDHMIPDADLNKFNFELTDRDQGSFDIKMMTFLWFNESVTPHERKGVQLDTQRALARTPVRIKGDFVSATLETAPGKRLPGDCLMYHARERWPNERKA